MSRIMRYRPKSRVSKALESGKKLKILDWYVHQGHQYEFFKTGHEFHLCGMKNSTPKWNTDHRPLNSNVILTNEKGARRTNFDVVMIRSPVNAKRYRPFIKNGTAIVAVMQTTNIFPVPPECRHIVWNSIDVMDAFKSKYPRKQHYYIVHGYDPNEFVFIDKNRNGKVLTVANVFKGRAGIMGYPLWEHVQKNMKNLDVIGHGNKDMYKSDREAKSLKHLIKIYNLYSIYFNPTQSSAMPRSRAEAVMCGMPLVTTDNFDIGRYFTHKKNAILTNDRNEIIREIKRILGSEQMRIDYGFAAREVAMKHFHIDDYLSKWNDLFGRL